MSVFNSLERLRSSGNAHLAHLSPTLRQTQVSPRDFLLPVFLRRLVKTSVKNFLPLKPKRKKRLRQRSKVRL